MDWTWLQSHTHNKDIKLLKHMTPIEFSITECQTVSLGDVYQRGDICQVVTRKAKMQVSGTFSVLPVICAAASHGNHFVILVFSHSKAQSASLIYSTEV